MGIPILLKKYVRFLPLIDHFSPLNILSKTFFMSSISRNVFDISYSVLYIADNIRIYSLNIKIVQQNL